MSAHCTPALDVRGGPQLLLRTFGFVSVAWPRLCCLASRIASREVPLLGFMREFVLCPVFIPVASALVAQDLVVALRSVAMVAIFSPNPRFSC